MSDWIDNLAAEKAKEEQRRAARQADEREAAARKAAQRNAMVAAAGPEMARTWEIVARHVERARAVGIEFRASKSFASGWTIKFGHYKPAQERERFAELQAAPGGLVLVLGDVYGFDAGPSYAPNPTLTAERTETPIAVGEVDDAWVVRLLGWLRDGAGWEGAPDHRATEIRRINQQRNEDWWAEVLSAGAVIGFWLLVCGGALAMCAR